MAVVTFSFLSIMFCVIYLAVSIFSPNNFSATNFESLINFPLASLTNYSTFSPFYVICCFN